MATSTTTQSRSRQVLIVDDNVDTAESLALLLSMEGHSALCAHNGEMALQLAARQPPEVVVLDIGLPGMDGYEVARRLRAVHSDKQMRIIVTSGYGRPLDKLTAERSGVDVYLLKPVDPMVVCAEVERVTDGAIVVRTAGLSD